MDHSRLGCSYWCAWVTRDHRARITFRAHTTDSPSSHTTDSPSSHTTDSPLTCKHTAVTELCFARSLLSKFCRVAAPYVNPEVEWRDIIIAVSVTGAVLLILLIVAIFAVVKSRQRTKQRLGRRDSLRGSLHASKASMVSARSLSRLPTDMQIQSRRRPPLTRPLEDSFFNLSGVTLGESSDHYDDKTRLDFHRPSTPDSLDHSMSYKPDSSSYRDSNLHPAHRGSLDNLTDGNPKFGQYAPRRLENEIDTVPAYPLLFDQAYKNKGFDERSLDRSELDYKQVSRPVAHKPRPPLSSTAHYTRAPLPSDRSLYEPQGRGQDFLQATPTKPRPPLDNRSPLYSERSDADQSFNRSVPDLLNTSRASGGRSKPRPPLNAASRSRPPQLNPQPAYSSSGRHVSRETLHSSSSARSFDDRPRPKATDI